MGRDRDMQLSVTTHQPPTHPTPQSHPRISPPTPTQKNFLPPHQIPRIQPSQYNNNNNTNTNNSSSSSSNNNSTNHAVGPLQDRGNLPLHTCIGGRRVASCHHH